MSASSVSPLRADPPAAKDAELAPFETLPAEILAIIADAVAAQSGWDLLSLSRVSRRTRQAAHRAGRKALSRATEDIKLQDDLIQASDSEPIHLLQSCLRPMPPFGRRICEFLPDSIDGPIIEPVQVKDRELRPTNLALDLFVDSGDAPHMDLIDFAPYPPQTLAIPVQARPKACSTCIESSGYQDMFMMSYTEEDELHLQALSDSDDRLLLVSTPNETSAHLISAQGTAVTCKLIRDPVQQAEQEECSGECQLAIARSSGITEEWSAIAVRPPKASGSVDLPRYFVMRTRGKTLEWVYWEWSGPLGQRPSLTTGVVNVENEISGPTSNMRLELVSWSIHGADDDTVVLVSWYERPSDGGDNAATGNLRLLEISLCHLVRSATTASNNGLGALQHPRACEPSLLNLDAPNLEPGAVQFHIAPDGQTLRCVRNAAGELWLLVYKRESPTDAWRSVPVQSVPLVKVYSMRAAVNGWLCLEARGAGFVKLVHLESSVVQTFDLLQQSDYAARNTDVLDIIADRLVYSEIGGKVHAILDLTGPSPVRVDLFSLIRQALPLGYASAATIYIWGEAQGDCSGCIQWRSHVSSPVQPLWLCVERSAADEQVGNHDFDLDFEPWEVAFLQLRPSSRDVKTFWMSPSEGLQLPAYRPHLRSVGADLVVQFFLRGPEGEDEWLADFRSRNMSRLGLSTAMTNGRHSTYGELLFPFAASGEPIWYRVRPSYIPIPDAEERVNHARLRDAVASEEICCPQTRPLPDYHLADDYPQEAVYIGGVKRLLAFLEAECPSDAGLCCRASPQITMYE